MATPVINPITGGLFFRVGETVDRVFSASGSPTAWEVSELPAGLALNTTTARLTGTLTHPGVSTAKLKAQNGDGWSAEVDLVFGIEIADYSRDDSVEVDIDVGTGKVTFSGKEEAPIAKLGDVLPWMIGFRKNGLLIDHPLVTVRVGAKENDIDPPVWLSEGGFTKVGSYESTRYRMIVTIDREKFQAPVSNHERRRSALAPMLAEIEWQSTNTDGTLDDEVPVFRRTSLHFGFPVAKDIVPDNEEA